MAKYTIITCDLCGGRIYRSGWFLGDWDGAVKVSAMVLEKTFKAMDSMYREFTYPGWRRRKYHICAKCVETIKQYCKGHTKEGELTANDRSNSPSEGQ